jgi:para-aminobenzoate synthetase component 1
MIPASPQAAPPWAACEALEAGWREPVEAAAPFADEPYALALLSGGAETARWSYLMRRPAQVIEIGAAAPEDPWAAAAAALGPRQPSLVDGPGFQGGLAGLAAYELGARREPSVARGAGDGWPDLAAGLYPALLAFDHRRRRILAIGRGAKPAEAQERAAEALGWLEAQSRAPAQGRLAAAFAAASPPQAYRAAVAEVVERIARGEIFQANVAQAWRGRLAEGVRPFDAFARLANQSPAPFAAYLRLAARAVVSNSPERFLAADAHGTVETRPIKGTRPRGRDRGEDAALASALAESAKDQAENLMIVDLMRNDLARACIPGSVEVPDLFALESFPNVHHLVSTVRGRLRPELSAVELMAAAFPPGSVTGAPKVQAMRVINAYEPPRGPYCGSIFWAGFDGALDSSVLIRTAAFTATDGGWAFEARAGAGVVADSDPALEGEETEAKIAALARALEQPA